LHYHDHQTDGQPMRRGVGGVCGGVHFISGRHPKNPPPSLPEGREGGGSLGRLVKNGVEENESQALGKQATRERPNIPTAVRLSIYHPALLSAPGLTVGVYTRRFILRRRRASKKGE